MGPRRGDPAV